jgi:hypothetical protein
MLRQATQAVLELAADGGARSEPSARPSWRRGGLVLLMLDLMAWSRTRPASTVQDPPSSGCGCEAEYDREWRPAAGAAGVLSPAHPHDKTELAAT